MKTSCCILKRCIIFLPYFAFTGVLEKMNSASKVGEIFTKAGETFHKLADMTVMLDPNAKELLVGGAKVRFRISDLYIVNFMSKIFGTKLTRSENIT